METRRTLRKRERRRVWAKRAAMAGTASVLATSLVVTTPNQAEALVPLLAVPIVASLGGSSAAAVTVGGTLAAIGVIGATTWADQTYFRDENPVGNPAMAWLGDLFGQTSDVSVPIDEPDFSGTGSSASWGDGSSWRANPDPLPETAVDKLRDGREEDAAGGGTRGNVKLSNVSLEPRHLNYSMELNAANPRYSGGIAGLVSIEYQCSNVSTGAVSSNKTNPSWSADIWPWTAESPALKSSHQLMCSSAGDQLDFVHIVPASAEAIAGYSGAADSVWTIDQTISLYRPGYEMNNPGYMTTVECVDPATGAVTYLYQSVPAGAGHIAVPSCLAAGVGVTRSIATDFLEGGKVRRPMIEVGRPSEQDPTSGDESWTDCDPGFNKTCHLTVWVDGVQCVKLAPECIGWLERTTTNPGSVVCKYGSRVVHISNCYGLEVYFNTPNGSAPSAVGENFDGNPATTEPPGLPNPPEVDPEKNPWPLPLAPPNPGPSTDPDTHEPPVPVPDPLPQPPTNPNDAPDPEPPVDPEPEPPTSPYPPPVTNPPGPWDSCMGGSAAFNPAQWVYMPVLCALQAAFVPNTQTVTTRIDTITGNLEGKAPVSWLIGFGDLVPPSASGCPNWTITVNNFSQNVVCGSSFTAAIVSMRGAFFGLMVTAMVWPFVRSLWYAAIPIFRVTPTGGR